MLLQNFMTKSVHPSLGESRAFFWCVWLATAALMAAGPTSVRAQGSKEKTPFLTIEQDGKAVGSPNGEVTLRRAPFVLVVRFPDMTVAKVHVAQSPAAYDLVRTTAPGDDLNPPGGGFAEADRNRDQALFLSPPGRPAFHFWPFPEGSNHRFDTIKADGGATVARRTVAVFVAPDRSRHAIEQFPGDVVYLAGRLVGAASGVEVQRQGLKLTFAGKPAPISSPASADSGGNQTDLEVLATVQGREITAGRFRNMYRLQLDQYKRAYGGQVSDELLGQLRVDLQVLQMLVDEEAALVESSRLGIAVSDAEVLERIRSMPALQDGKRFVGEAKYRKILAAQTPPMQPEAFAEVVRRGMLVEKLELAVTKGVGEGLARTDAYKAYLQQAKGKMQIVIDRDVLQRAIARK
jgi:hypothetical protein